MDWFKDWFWDWLVQGLVWVMIQGIVWGMVERLSWGVEPLGLVFGPSFENDSGIALGITLGD